MLQILGRSISGVCPVEGGGTASEMLVSTAAFSCKREEQCDKIRGFLRSPRIDAHPNVGCTDVIKWHLRKLRRAVGLDQGSEPALKVGLREHRSGL